ncbi:hypothetical protein TNCV_676521 [Trichonephila clavipes]|nr:hypothetical protein TNCV_676521 [Trichonephila clavipes]
MIISRRFDAKIFLIIPRRYRIIRQTFHRDKVVKLVALVTARRFDINPMLDGKLTLPSLVYADKPQTLDHLEDNIRRVIADIRPQMLEKVLENWTSRLDYIRASCGSPMPEIIFKM